MSAYQNGLWPLWVGYGLSLHQMNYCSAAIAIV
jgi:hypothetical protein